MMLCLAEPARDDEEDRHDGRWIALLYHLMGLGILFGMHIGIILVGSIWRKLPISFLRLTTICVTQMCIHTSCVAAPMYVVGKIGGT